MTLGMVKANKNGQTVMCSMESGATALVLAEENIRGQTAIYMMESGETTKEMEEENKQRQNILNRKL